MQSQQLTRAARWGPMMVLLVCAVGASAVDVEWAGRTWTGEDGYLGLTSYGGESALEVTASYDTGIYGIGAATYQTDDEFRVHPTPSVEVAFYDGGPGTPGPQLHLADYSYHGIPGQEGAEIAFGAWQGQGRNNYYVQWLDYEGTTTTRDINTGVPRTAGVHKVKIAMTDAGVVEFYLDDAKLEVDTSTLSPSFFEEVTLAVYGDETGTSATFTSCELEGGGVVDPPEPDKLKLTIDVLPGCRRNVISLECRYWVPVAVLGETSIDVRRIARKSIRMAGARPHCAYYCDFDRDGDKDLILFFYNRELDLPYGDSTVTLTATYDDLEADGTDEVTVPQPRRRPHRW